MELISNTFTSFESHGTLGLTSFIGGYPPNTMSWLPTAWHVWLRTFTTSRAWGILTQLHIQQSDSSPLLVSSLAGGGYYMKDGMVSTQISDGPSSVLFTSCPPYIHKSCVFCLSSLTSTEQNLDLADGPSPFTNVAVCVIHWFLPRSKNLILVKSNFQRYLS